MRNCSFITAANLDLVVEALIPYLIWEARNMSGKESNDVVWNIPLVQRFGTQA